MEKTTRHNAIATCNDCKAYLHSPGGGRFVTCSCGKSFIDQERWSALYIRLSNATLVEQICPHGCEYEKEHSKNKKIEDFKELQKYLKENYKIKMK